MKQPVLVADSVESLNRDMATEESGRALAVGSRKLCSVPRDHGSAVPVEMEGCPREFDAGRRSSQHGRG